MPTCTRRPRPARRLALSLVAVAILLVAAGCSSDSSDGAAKKDSGKATTTTRAPIDPDDVEGGTDAYVEAMVPLIGSDASMPPEDLEKARNCLAPKWVDIIGLKGFTDAGIAPEDLEKLEGGLQALGVDEATAQKLVKAFGECDIDVRKMMLTQLEGAGFDEETKACLEDALTLEGVEAELVGNLSGTESSDAMGQAAQKCVRPPE